MYELITIILMAIQHYVSYKIILKPHVNYPILTENDPQSSLCFGYWYRVSYLLITWNNTILKMNCLCIFRYTKMGFAGNKEPQIVIPSSIATPPTVKQKRMSGLFDDLDFHIGDEASLSNNHDVKV